jgi:hypothetical protein
MVESLTKEYGFYSLGKMAIEIYLEKNNGFYTTPLHCNNCNSKVSVVKMGSDIYYSCLCSGIKFGSLGYGSLPEYESAGGKVFEQLSDRYEWSN